MQFADAEQWLGLAALVSWIVVTGMSVAGRLPRVGSLPDPVLAGAGVAALLFAVQAMLVDRVEVRPQVPAADESTLQLMVAHRAPAPTALAETLSDLGGTAGMLGVATVAVAALVLARRHWEAVVVVVAAMGGDFLTEALKDVYQRPRPPELTRLTAETSYSLPSGHSLGSFVTLGIVAAIGARLLHRAPARVGVVAGMAVLVVAIGMSRLYLGVHWLTDVLDGWLVGGAWLALCVAALVTISSRGERPAPPVPAMSGAAP